MKSSVITLILAIAMLVACGKPNDEAAPSSAAHEMVTRSGPYVYCNVHLSDACFGVGPGDHLRMDIPVDSTVYQLGLAGGGRVEIHYGTNVPLPPELVSSDVTRSTANGEVKYLRQDNGGDTQLSYAFKPKHSAIGMMLYVKVLAPAEGRRSAASFIENFRPCIPR